MNIHDGLQWELVKVRGGFVPNEIMCPALLPLEHKNSLILMGTRLGDAYSNYPVYIFNVNENTWADWTNNVTGIIHRII